MQCVTCTYENPPGAKFCSACGSVLDINLQGVHTHYLSKGARLQNGAYAVGDVLGEGGFGITYKGGEFSLRRYVAIKEFFPQGCLRQGATVVPASGLAPAEYNDFKARFIEEARTLAQFSHPSIVRVFGVFQENNTAYMVMEFLEGNTLQKLIDQNGNLLEQVAVAHVRSVADALAHVHRAGLIHRDIKPDNICITNGGRTVLIDFGTARAFTIGKTVRHTAMVTPGYAPLEQYGQQARFGAFTDVYALGATLYHCLTGEAPPPATDRAAGVDLLPPDQRNPMISARVSQAVMYAMQMKASERPPGIKEFLEALEGSASPTVPSPPSTPSPTSPPVPAFDPLKGAVLTVSAQGQFPTIAAAIAAASDGDCIVISPGLYNECLQISKGLHFVGDQTQGRVVVESGLGNVCKIHGGQGSIQGITFRGIAGQEGKRFFSVNVLNGEWAFQGCEMQSDSLAAFHVGGKAQVTLRSCKIRSEKLDGILIEEGKTCEVFDCVLSENGRHGFHQKVAPVEPTRLSGSECENNGGSGTVVCEGQIQLDGCQLSFNRRAGLELDGQTRAQIQHCRLSQNGAQGVIAGSGVTGEITSCQVTNNRFGAFDVPASSRLVRTNIRD